MDLQGVSKVKAMQAYIDEIVKIASRYPDDEIALNLINSLQSDVQPDEIQEMDAITRVRSNETEVDENDEFEAKVELESFECEEIIDEAVVEKARNVGVQTRDIKPMSLIKWILGYIGIKGIGGILMILLIILYRSKRV